MGLHARLRRRPTGVRREELGEIRLLPRIAARFVQPDRFTQHQLRRPHLAVGARDGKLNALVSPDGAPENFAIAGISGCGFNEPFGVADAFRGDQHPLRVHAGQDVAKSLAFFSDQRAGGDLHVVEEQLGGRMIHHRADRTNGQPFHRPHVDEKHRQAVRLLRARLTRRRPREEEEKIGMRRPADPYLLAIDEIAIAVAPGGGAQRPCVRSRSRLRHAKSLHPKRAVGDTGQILRLLRVGAMPQDRAHRIHLSMAGGGVAARAVDFLQDRRPRR